MEQILLPAKGGGENFRKKFLRFRVGNFRPASRGRAKIGQRIIGGGTTIINSIFFHCCLVLRGPVTKTPLNSSVQNARYGGRGSNGCTLLYYHKMAFLKPHIHLNPRELSSLFKYCSYLYSRYNLHKTSGIVGNKCLH